MPIKPKQAPQPTSPDAHAVCLKRSGNNSYGDIPLSVSISMAATGGDGPNGRITTHRLHIQPDAGRLLSAELVSDDFYERIRNSGNVLSEGEGAERLFAALGALQAPADAGRQSPGLRYSMRAAFDRRLIRNFLQREGHGPLPTHATGDATRIIDVRHALMTIAGVCRAADSWQTLPGKLRDYDLDSRKLTAAELCGLYGVEAPDDGSESSALLRLAHAAHEAANGQTGSATARQQAGRFGQLRTLGNALDYLGRAPCLPFVDRNDELSPPRVGLLLHKGKWIPVVHPNKSNGKAGGDYCLYSLPEGRPLVRPVGISAPLVGLDILESESAWTADADDRLRRICGREGEPFDLRALRDAFTLVGGGWLPPEPDPTPSSSGQSNTWAWPREFQPGEELFLMAGRAARAINRQDADGSRTALDDIARHAGNDNPCAGEAARILLQNMRLAASRAGLLGDGRKAWLRQMALLLDPRAWPADSPAASPCFAALLYGDGPVARHNRIAIGSRSALGIPASDAAMDVLMRPPRLQKEDAGCA